MICLRLNITQVFIIRIKTYLHEINIHESFKAIRQLINKVTQFIYKKKKKNLIPFFLLSPWFALSLTLSLSRSPPFFLFFLPSFFFCWLFYALIYNNVDHISSCKKKKNTSNQSRKHKLIFYSSLVNHGGRELFFV